MNESNFAIVLDVLAREIDMLRYQLKEKEKENAKLRNRVKALEEGNAKQHEMFGDLLIKQHEMFEAGCEKHE